MADKTDDNGIKDMVEQIVSGFRSGWFKRDHQETFEPYGTMAYMVALYGITTEPYQPFTQPTWWHTTGLTPDERALLERIERKLDELLKRAAPEAEQVAEIRKRVMEALDKTKGK